MARRKSWIEQFDPKTGKWYEIPGWEDRSGGSIQSEETAAESSLMYDDDFAPDV